MIINRYTRHTSNSKFLYLYELSSSAIKDKTAEKSEEKNTLSVCTITALHGLCGGKYKPMQQVD